MAVDICETSHSICNGMGCKNMSAFRLCCMLWVLTLINAHSTPEQYHHTGGGPTSVVMRDVISKLPPVQPNVNGVRDGDKLMRTVTLNGDYQVLSQSAYVARC